jgi:murein L,D-transpeptidase YcbB/YkuD
MPPSLGRVLCQDVADLALTRLLVVLVFGLTLGAAAAVCAAEGTAVEAATLERRVETLQSEGRLAVRGASIASTIVLPEFYVRRGFSVAWSDPRDVEDLLAAIDASTGDGLDPADYHQAALRRLLNEIEGSQQPETRVDLDLLLTDACLRLAYHLYFGKADPQQLDAHWNVPRTLGDADPIEVVGRALAEDDLRGMFARLRPRQAIYARMCEQLIRHRAIRDAGGWPEVPGTSGLRPGVKDERVLVLRKRLEATTDLAAEQAAVDAAVFDDVVVEAVKRFQTRHGLDADGVVGRRTLAALNVPVEQRIDQIRVNLERGRWLLHDLGGDLVIVNVAGYKLYLLQEGSVAWQSRVQVGKPYRKTPIFRAEMTHLVLNPDWTVPPTIFAQDMLPKLRRDPGYLAERGLRVVDARGRPVSAETIDWKAVPSHGGPYYLRQDPSPDNPLGRVKFMFPNPYAVFLHDTPNIAGFERADRALSSGCIRVEDPLELARRVLDRVPGWSAEAIQAVVDEGASRTVSLPQPLPVLLLYWTTALEADGRMHFYDDIYGRDRAVLKALDGEFVVRRKSRAP